MPTPPRSNPPAPPAGPVRRDGQGPNARHDRVPGADRMGVAGFACGSSNGHRGPHSPEARRKDGHHPRGPGHRGTAAPRPVSPSHRRRSAGPPDENPRRRSARFRNATAGTPCRLAFVSIAPHRCSPSRADRSPRQPVRGNSGLLGRIVKIRIIYASLTSIDPLKAFRRGTGSDRRPPELEHPTSGESHSPSRHGGLTLFTRGWV
jgi:hypothetical protein